MIIDKIDSNRLKSPFKPSFGSLMSQHDYVKLLSLVRDLSPSLEIKY